MRMSGRIILSLDEAGNSGDDQDYTDNSKANQCRNLRDVIPNLVRKGKNQLHADEHQDN